jgi:ABC-2 type transport system permease protein
MTAAMASPNLKKTNEASSVRTMVHGPAIQTLAWRELVRFFRQRNRVVGAIATPLVFWLMLGLGLNNTFIVEGRAGQVSGSAEGGMGYLAFFYPGAVTLMVLFTAIFSTISVIEDRREGFLQGVLVSPASRAAIVAGKLVGGSLIATIQGVILLAIWWVFFDWPGLVFAAASAGVLFAMALGLTGIGLCFAWPMDSTAGFHAVMNLLLMPMWFLSGAVFPLLTAGPLKWVMWANPLTYSHATLARTMQGDAAPGIGIPIGWAAAIMFLCAAVTWWIATRIAQRPMYR